MRWSKRMPKINEEKEQSIREELERDDKLSIKDYFAMVTSALLVFMPAAILVLLFLYLIIWLFFL